MSDHEHEVYIEAIRPYGDWAHGGDPEAAGTEWWHRGFSVNEMREWLDARCFEPKAARALASIGCTPQEAARRTEAATGEYGLMGLGDYADTIGYKVANGDLSVSAVGLALPILRA